MGASSTTSTVIVVGSHMDARNVEMARAAFNAVLETATGDVVLDLVNLESIDATGLGLITAVHLRCERSGVRLVLRNCPRDIRRVLAVTRLNRILHLDRGHVSISA